MSYGDIAEYLGEGGPRQVGRVMALWGGGVPGGGSCTPTARCWPGTSAPRWPRTSEEGTPLRRPARRRTAARSTCGGRRLAGMPACAHGADSAAECRVRVCWNARRDGNCTARLSSRPLVSGRPPARAAPRRRPARVVEHAGGPLLVLAGPGTGKTTTIVEAVVDRVARRGIDPGRVLVLTFSRKAAEELRERIALRLDRTIRQPLAHDLPQLRVRPGAARVRAGRRAAADPAARSRAAARGAQAAARRGRRRRPRLARAAARRRSAPGASPPSCATSCCGPPSAGWTAAALADARPRGTAATTGSRPGRFLDAYAARFDLAPVPAYDYAEIVRIAGRAAAPRGGAGPRARRLRRGAAWTSTRTPTRRRRSCCVQLAGDGRELIAVGDPDQSIYAFRGADVDAIRRFPDRFRAPGRRARRGRRAARLPAQRAGAAGRVAAGRGPAASRARPADRGGRAAITASWFPAGRRSRARCGS